ncbi:MAG: hypothetical protein WCO72_10910 [Betaproteobacteria bacterium]
MQKTIDIEFAPKTPVLALLKAGVVSVVLSVVALCIVLGLVIYVSLVNQVTQGLLEENLMLQQQTNALKSDKKKTDKNTSNSSNQQGLITVASQLNLPWGELLKAFDSRSSNQVALLEFNPDTNTGVIKIVAEARNSAQMTNYIEGLKKLKVIDDIKLTHHEVNASEQLLPIRFELEGYWVGAFPR